MVKTTHKKDKEIRAVQRMKVVFFAFWIICVAITIGLAVMPGGLPMYPGADKMLHCLVFCILMLWPATTFDRKSNVALAAVFLLGIGILMEYLQTFIPGRSAELMDVVFDGVGLIVGTIIGFLFRDSYQSLLPLAYVQAYLKPLKN
jgi:uncharacterized protein YacL